MDKLVADAIPNIRFNVAKSYGHLIDVLKRLPASGTIYTMEKSGLTNGHAPAPSPKSQELIQERILPNLQKLQSDDDVDVRYFASVAAAKAGGDEMEIS
jgi:serine/threonine-protein phosphatase 2A regulatory subunit A